MKLFVSALLLAAAPVALAQNQAPAPNPDPALEAKIRAQAAQIRVQLQTQMDLMSQTGCPLYLKSASVAPAAQLASGAGQTSPGPSAKPVSVMRPLAAQLSAGCGDAFSPARSATIPSEYSSVAA